MEGPLRAFLESKVRNLAVRAHRLAQLTHHSVGIRPEDLPFTPSRAHFEAANRRLQQIDADVRRQLEALSGMIADDARGASRAGQAADPDDILHRCALVEREVDRARRAYALFFEVFAQRGTRFARALAASDAIAADCFRLVRQTAPGLLPPRLLKPVTYLEHSFSPATFRRGVMLRRLMGEHNPFPLLRVPFERAESPWGMGVLLHEIGHNLHSDLGIWEENRSAVQRRVFMATRDLWLTRIWGRWHKEIFADLIALLLGGPASGRAMADFLAYPASRVLAFRATAVHPLPYLRLYITGEMLRRMGYPGEAQRQEAVWTRLYAPHVERVPVPARLLATAGQVIPQVVDEIVYQPRRNLGQRTLADIVPFSAADERTIRNGAAALVQGALPPGFAPRYVVGASRYAFDQKLAPPADIVRVVMRHLTDGIAGRSAWTLPEGDRDDGLGGRRSRTVSNESNAA